MKHDIYVICPKGVAFSFIVYSIPNIKHPCFIFQTYADVEMTRSWLTISYFKCI